jgi:hypothetical protein
MTRCQEEGHERRNIGVALVVGVHGWLLHIKLLVYAGLKAAAHKYISMILWAARGRIVCERRKKKLGERIMPLYIV